MIDYIQQIGSYMTARVCPKSGRLTLHSRDTDSIQRVYCSDMQDGRSAYGRGWSLYIPEDTHGEMTFSDGRLAEFTDVCGKGYGFFYCGGRLSYIATEEGPISYHYNADGMLTRVVYPDGECISISYRDIFSIHDITVSRGQESVCAVSYIDGMEGGIEYIYEYAYDGCERVETGFYELSKKPKKFSVVQY